MKKYSELVNKQFKVNRTRNIYTIIGIVLGIILFTAVGNINYYISNKDIVEAKYYKGNYEAIFKNISQEQLELIKGNVEISTYGIIQKIQSTNASDGLYKDVEIYALDNNSYKDIFAENIELVDGNIPASHEEIALSEIAINKFNKKLYNYINIKDKSYKIVGIYKNNDNNSFIHRGLTYFDKGLENSDISIAINIKSKNNIEKTILEIANNVGISNNGYGPIIELNEFLIDGYESQSLGVLKNLDEEKLTIIGVNILIILLTSVLTYGSINVSMKERIKCFSTLRCIGATEEKIRYLLIKESCVLAALSIVPGLIIGNIVSFSIIEIVFNKIMKMNLNGLNFKINWQVVLGTIVMTIFTVTISSIIPVIKSGKITPIQGVKNGGITKKKLKPRKSKLIRKIFGYKGEIAYKNIRGNNKSFIVTTITLSIVLISFTIYSGYSIGALKSNNEEYEKEKDISIRYYQTMFDDKYLDMDSKIRAIFKKQETIQDYLYGKVDSESISTQLDIGISPIFKGLKSNNIIQNEEEFNSNGEKYTYIDSSKLIIYNNQALQEILPYIESENVTIEDFKDNGVIFINKNVESFVLSREYKNVSSLKKNERLSLYLEKDKYNSLRSERNLDAELDDLLEIDIKFVGNINSNKIYNYRNNDLDNGIVMIASQEFYENNKNIIDPYIDKASRFITDFNIIDNEYENINLESIKKYSDEERLHYIDNKKSSLDIKREIIGISTVVYTILFISMTIGFINIINNKRIDMSLRKKEFGTMIAIGIKKEDLKKIIILEGIVQWFVASLIGGVISYIALKIIFIVYKYLGDIENSKAPYWIIAVGIIILLIINLVASITSLNRFKNFNTMKLIREEE